MSNYQNVNMRSILSTHRQEIPQRLLVRLCSQLISPSHLPILHQHLLGPLCVQMLKHLTRQEAAAEPLNVVGRYVVEGQLFCFAHNVGTDNRQEEK